MHNTLISENLQALIIKELKENCKLSEKTKDDIVCEKYTRCYECGATTYVHDCVDYGDRDDNDYDDDGEYILILEKCDKCDKTFMTPEVLKSHKDYHHAEEPKIYENNMPGDIN
jgi:hypothetical protein